MAKVESEKVNNTKCPFGRYQKINGGNNSNIIVIDRYDLCGKKHFEESQKQVMVKQLKEKRKNLIFIMLWFWGHSTLLSSGDLFFMVYN